MMKAQQHQIFNEIESNDLYGMKRTIAAMPSALSMRRMPDGRTPLHSAVVVGNAAMVRELLKHGAVYEMTDTAGNTCLHLACELNNSAVLKELLSESGARQACKAVNKAGCTAPDLAMQRGFKEIIQLISDALGPASLTDRHIKSSKSSQPGSRRRSSGAGAVPAPLPTEQHYQSSSSQQMQMQQHHQQQHHQHAMQVPQQQVAPQQAYQQAAISSSSSGSSDGYREMRSRLSKLESLVHAQMELITEWHNTLASVHSHDRLIQEFEERLNIVEGRVAAVERHGGSAGAGGASGGSSVGSAVLEEAIMRLSSRLSKVEGAMGGGVDMNPRHMAPGSLSAVMSPSGSAGGYQGPGRRSSKTMESLGMQPEQRRGTADMNAYDMARR